MTTRSLFFVHIDLTELDREQTYNYTIAGVPRSVRYWTVHSRPDREDSDGDGLGDKVDPEPMIPNVFYDFGSSSYWTERIPQYIDVYPQHTEKYGYISGHDVGYDVYLRDCLNLVMDDFDASVFGKKLILQEDFFTDAQWGYFCSRFNSLVIGTDILSTNQGKRTHYFRNKLNRAPKTLAEMQAVIDNDEQSWVLLPFDESLYHIYDTEAAPEGVYNLKFLSADGKYEAVYNKDGVLLTEENDERNMGTYNYSFNLPNRYVNNAQHWLLDMNPYDLWGNTPDMGKGEDKRNLPLTTEIREYRYAAIRCPNHPDAPDPTPPPLDYPPDLTIVDTI